MFYGILKVLKKICINMYLNILTILKSIHLYIDFIYKYMKILMFRYITVILQLYYNIKWYYWYNEFYILSSFYKIFILLVLFIFLHTRNHEFLTDLLLLDCNINIISCVCHEIYRLIRFRKPIFKNGTIINCRLYVVAVDYLKTQSYCAFNKVLKGTFYLWKFVNYQWWFILKTESNSNHI